VANSWGPEVFAAVSLQAAKSAVPPTNAICPFSALQPVRIVNTGLSVPEEKL